MQQATQIKSHQIPKSHINDTVVWGIGLSGENFLDLRFLFGREC